MEAGVLTPTNHEGRERRQSVGSCIYKVSQGSGVPNEMLQTTLSRFNARKLPTAPLPLMDEVVARFMNISPEQWEQVNSAIKYLNDHFKDDSLSWLTVRWLVASHPEQFLPAPYNSYEELLAHVNETKRAIDRAKKEASHWRESCQRLHSETKAWKNKLRIVEADMARLNVTSKRDGVQNTAMTSDVADRRHGIVESAAMAFPKDCETVHSHIHFPRCAKSQASKGTALHKQESAFVQFSTEAGREQGLCQRHLATKQKKTLSPRPTLQPSIHDEQEQSRKALNHPTHSCADHYIDSNTSLAVVNMRPNGGTGKTCTTTTTTKTTTTTSYATVSANGGEDRQKVSVDGVVMAMQGGTGVHDAADPAVMVGNPPAVQVLNRMQNILRCVSVARPQDDRKAPPPLPACGREETKCQSNAASPPNVEVLYVQYQHQKGRNGSTRDESGISASSPKSPQKPVISQQGTSVRKVSTKSRRTAEFSLTPLDRLVALKQTTSITEYVKRFMSQYGKGTDIPEAVAVRIFLDNLLPDFRAYTLDKQPETLADAIRLAYQVEQLIVEERYRGSCSGEAAGIADHPQEPSEDHSSCGQLRMGHTVATASATHCVVETGACIRRSSIVNDPDINSRSRFQTVRQNCQTSSTLHHDVSPHESASFRENYEDVRSSASPLCLNNYDADVGSKNEGTLPKSATEESRTTQVMRRSNLGNGEGGNAAEVTFRALSSNCLAKAKRNLTSKRTESSTSIGCTQQHQQRFVPEVYRERIPVSVEQQTSSDKEQDLFSTNKASHAAAVSTGSAAPFVSFNSSAFETEIQPGGSFVSSLGSSTDSSQTVGDLRTAESFESLWRENGSAIGYEDVQRSCRSDGGEFPDSRHHGGRQATETGILSSHGQAESFSTAHPTENNSPRE
nr:TPA: hypothetical protein BN1204_011710 [Neospora caninum Liverpool]